MKSQDAIQRAHDLLAPIASGEIPVTENTARESLIALNAALAVLCWVLEDPEAHHFEENLRRVEQSMADKGIILLRGNPATTPQRN